MTYPQQYQQPVAAQYPQQPQYAPPPAQQYPPQPYAPQQTQYVPAAYQQGGYFAAQAYQPAGAPMPPAPPLPTGSLDSFYEQPSTAGGPSISWQGKPVGTQYIGVVARPVTNADVQAQTNKGTGQVVTFKDGRPKFVMIVPLNVNPSPEFPDGRAAWWVKGGARDELAAAMARAGAPAGPPESGATIRITKTGERQIQGMNPATQLQIEYFRPQGVAPVAQATPAAPLGGPVEQYNNPSAPYSDPAYHTPQQVQFTPQAPMQQGVPPQSYVIGDTTTVGGMQFTKVAENPFPAPVQAPIAAPAVQAPLPATAPAAPQGMDASQAALWAQLTGGQPLPTTPAPAVPQG